MVMSHQELLKKIEAFPTMEKFLAGAYFRNKTVSRAGKSSAVIFLPQYLLGQKYKVFLVPEDAEVTAISEALEKKYNEVASLKYKMRKLESDNLEANFKDPKEEEKPEVVVDKALEEEDAY